MAKANRDPSVNPIRASNTWGCKVKLPDGSRYSVSLRLPWPGNVREAKDRAAQLQREVDDRKLDETLKWLGGKPAEALKIKLGLKPLERGETRTLCVEPRTWWEARDAWLATYPVRRTVPGKINDVDLTRKAYEWVSKSFCAWAETTGVAFKKKSATTVVLMYLRDRRRGANPASLEGVSTSTLAHDLRHLHVWFGWMQRRGWYNQMDKETIFDDACFGGDEGSPENFIPDWQLDLDTLNYLHDHRHESGRIFSAWRLYVLVRGLGCRPKEAMTLSWDTVNLDEGLVVFRNTKEAKIQSASRGRGAQVRTNRNRTVPICFQWTLDALLEMQALGAPAGGAVALNAEGNYHRGLSQAANAFYRVMKSTPLYRWRYGLKACQRAGVAQMETILPPWVVARIAGHSLTTHMAHYSTNESHLPTRQLRDYGQFDTLSFAGSALVEKHRHPAMLRDIMDRGEL